MIIKQETIDTNSSILLITKKQDLAKLWKATLLEVEGAQVDWLILSQSVWENPINDFINHKYALMVIACERSDWRGAALIQKTREVDKNIEIIVIVEQDEGYTDKWISDCRIYDILHNPNQLPQRLKISVKNALEAYYLKQQIRILSNDPWYNITHQLHQEHKELLPSSKFLDSMSHEFQSPLNSIMGYVQILIPQLKTKELPEEFIKYLKNIKHCGQNLSDLVNNLLELYRVKSLPLLQESLNIHHLCEDVFNAFQTQAQKKKICLTKEWDSSLPISIQSDRNRVFNVLMPVLKNAIQFTEPGGNVWFKVSRKKEDIQFEIRDTGIGLDPLQTHKIFNTFQKVESDRSRVLEGAGLGLSLAKQAIELLEGEIEVKSQIGQGACFLIRFPLIPIESFHFFSSTNETMELIDKMKDRISENEPTSFTGTLMPLADTPVAVKKELFDEFEKLSKLPIYLLDKILLQTQNIEKLCQGIDSPIASLIPQLLKAAFDGDEPTFSKLMKSILMELSTTLKQE